MIIDFTSDLHGCKPLLQGGDLLVICGDLTATDTEIEYVYCLMWLANQKYRKKIVIAGNHDNGIRKYFDKFDKDGQITYLQDSGCEFEGLSIYGSPWTKTFLGINPRCTAFTVDTEEELASKFSLIPNDTDILITHGPPNGIFDQTCRGDLVGSESLMKKVCEIKPLLHAFGHIHEEGGKQCWTPWTEKGTRSINCSHVNESYQGVHSPIRIIL